MKLALIFPGQGTQYRGMGSDLARDFVEAAVMRDQIESGFREVEPGMDLRATMDVLTSADRISTDVCQAIVFTHSAMAWAALQSQIRLSTDHFEIIAALGHSFGELTAHFAAGSLDVKRMAALVLQRGRLMAEAPAGGLLNIEDLDSAEVRRAVADFVRQSPHRRVFVAIDQAPRLHAVGGRQEDLKAFAETLRLAGVSCRMVRGVNKPLHTPLQIDVRRRFGEVLERVTFRRPDFPVLSTTRGDLSEPARVTEELAGQIDSEMRFAQAVRRLVECEPDRYLVFGPGSKIAELLTHYNNVDSERLRVVERSKQVSRVSDELGGRNSVRVGRQERRKLSHSFLRRALRNHAFGREQYVLIEPGDGSRDLGEALDRSGTFILFKGSFDPIHLGHVALFEACRLRHPDAWGAFALSTHTHKGLLDRRQVLGRARLILKAGFPVVISRSGYFFENIEWLRSRAPELRLVFITGVDALRRLVGYFSPEQFGTRFSGVVFEYATREGPDDLYSQLRAREVYAGIRRMELKPEFLRLSSSRIRALAAEGESAEVTSLMPPCAARAFLERFHRAPRVRASGGLPSVASMRERLAHQAPRPSPLWSDRDHAAVALILAGSDHDLHLCLIRRAEYVRDPWSGHVALPGGGAEAGEVDPFMVSARETLEEVGLKLTEPQRVGLLPAVTVRLAGRQTPLSLSGCVYYVGERLLPLTQSREVAHAFWVPMTHLWDANNATRLRFAEDDANLSYPAIGFGSELVWGITLRVLTQFSDAIGCPLPHFEEIPGMRDTSHVSLDRTTVTRDE